jgi:hypothetical protein
MQTMMQPRGERSSARTADAPVPTTRYNENNGHVESDDTYGDADDDYDDKECHDESRNVAKKSKSTQIRLSPDSEDDDHDDDDAQTTHLRPSTSSPNDLSPMTRTPVATTGNKKNHGPMVTNKSSPSEFFPSPPLTDTEAITMINRSAPVNQSVTKKTPSSSTAKAKNKDVNNKSSNKKVTTSAATITPAGKTLTIPMTSEEKETYPQSNETNSSKKKQKNISAFERTEDRSLQSAKKFVEYTEVQYKAYQDDLKQLQKEIKKKQQELEQYKRQEEQLSDRVTEALTHKREAAKQYKVLLKEWKKVESANQAQIEKFHNLQKELKDKNRELMKKDTTRNSQTDITTKKAKISKTSSNGRNGKKKVESSSDDDDSDNDNDNHVRNDSESSDSDDSDWGRGRRQQSNKRKRSGSNEADESGNNNDVVMETESPTPRRCRRVSQQQEWNCPLCTLLNDPTRTKCKACYTSKPGTFPDLD